LTQIKIFGLVTPLTIAIGNHATRLRGRFEEHNRSNLIKSADSDPCRNRSG